MQTLIEDFQNFTQEIAQRLTAGQSYMDRYSDKAKIYTQIASQQAKIKELINDLKCKSQESQYIRRCKNDPIPDHFAFRSQKIQQIDSEVHERDQNFCNFIKSNHKIKMSIRIQEIHPVLAFGEKIQFDTLRFNLHQVNQSYSSCLVRYLPSINIHKRSDLVQNNLIRYDRAVDLSIQHTLRAHNLDLYSEMLQIPAKIVAQSSHGLILGIAQINFRQLFKIAPLKNHIEHVIFKNTQFTSSIQKFSKPKISAKIQINLEYFPISHSLQQLMSYQKQRKLQKSKKSKSPTRIIINQSPRRDLSPKQKRHYAQDLVCSPQPIIQLTLISNCEFRLKLPRFDLKQSMSITYKKMTSIKQKHIQVVKNQNIYFLKILIIKEDKQNGHLSFLFMNKQYSCTILQNSLLQQISFDQYMKAYRDSQAVKPINKYIDIGNGIYVFARQNIRIIKNAVKQTIVDGMLARIFIKTPFLGAQLLTKSPFKIHQITHNQDGYMISYMYFEQNPIQTQLDVTLPFFIRSHHNQIIQIHAFLCTISPRKVTLDTPVHHINTSSLEQFVYFAMAGTVSQQQVYQIYSTTEKVSVVNGKNYKYSQYANPSIILQKENLNLGDCEFDLILIDQKLRCFFIRMKFYENQQTSQSQ